MARSYDLKLVVCTVGGVPINNYGEDDAITFEWTSDLTARKSSADGQSTYSRLNDRELIATITLMATSKAISLLMGAIELQHGDNVGIGLPIIAPLPFVLIDPILGDSVLGDCVLISRPTPNKAKEVGEIEFRISLPSPKISMGLANFL